VIHVTPWSPLVGLDLSPSAFTLSGLLLLVALSRFQLLDLVPVARDTLLEHLTDGVVVLDEQNRIMELNPAAQKLLRADPPLIGQRVEQVCAAITPNPTALETQSEIVLAKNPACFLEVRTSPLRDRRNHVTGRLVVLHDVTQRKKIETALQELNTDLESLIGARTAELEATVGALQNEIAERQRVETSLRRMEESLAERIAEQSRKLSALYEVMLFAGKSLTVPEMHAQALATIIGVINCQAGCIYQLEDNGRTLRLIAQRGLTPEMQAQIETLPADWFLSDAIPRTVIDLAAKVNIPATLRLPGLEAFLGVPTHLQDRPTGLLSVFWKHAHSLAVEDIALFHAMADQLGILEENARLREQSATTAVLQERRRLARDLHDSVTQSLHSLVLSADTTCALAQRRQLDVLDATAAQLAESARQALKEMRLMLFELRLAALDTMDLVEQLETRLDMVERRAGVDVQLVVDQTAYIPKEWTNDLCAIAMEALNNALKHAQATRVRVTLHAHLSAFRLEIADNGCGFDPQHPRAGMGLASMQERADRLGGSLAIESSPGNGTKVCVEIGDADS
jgi:signal transduction histidine kinase